MTEIPPDLPSSVAQSGVQARELSREREARGAGQADAARRQVKSVDDAGSTVETTDDDVAIFTDAEGSGSQGRVFRESAGSEDGVADAPAADKGITCDEDGRLHLDLEA